MLSDSERRRAPFGSVKPNAKFFTRKTFAREILDGGTIYLPVTPLARLQLSMMMLPSDIRFVVSLRSKQWISICREKRFFLDVEKYMYIHKRQYLK